MSATTGNPPSPPAPETIHPAGSAALLALLAVGHRAMIAAWTTSLSTDSAYYLWTAEAFAKGEVDRALRAFSGFHPLYPVLTAVFGIPLGDLERGGYLVSVLAGGLGVVPLYFLVRELWNARIARWTGLLYAFHPPLSLESADVMTTGLFLGLFLAALTLWILALRGAPWPYYPLGGVVAALTYLVRAEGIALPAALAAGAAAAAWRGRAGTRGRLAGGVLTAAVAWILIAGPYLIWLHGAHGRWTLTARSSATRLWANLHKQIPPPPPATGSAAPTPANPDPATLLKPAETSADPVLARDPFFQLATKKILQAVYWPILPLMALGFIFNRSLGGRKGTLVVALILVAVLSGPTLLAFALSRYYRPSHRYFLPGVTLLLPWAAAGAVVLYDALSRVASTARPGRLVVVRTVFFAAILVPLLYKTVRPHRREETSFREAGAWLRPREMPEPRRLLSTSVKIAWYGGCGQALTDAAAGSSRWIFRGDGAPVPWEPCPAGSVDSSVSDRTRRLRDLSLANRAPYFVMDEEAFSEWGEPGLPGELESVGFRRVATFGGSPSGENGTRRVWIYRLGT